METHFVEKTINFDIEWNEYRKSVHAEIWFADRLWGDTKLECGDYLNCDFSLILSGSKFKFCRFDKLLAKFLFDKNQKYW